MRPPAGDSKNGTHLAYLEALGAMLAGEPRWTPAMAGYLVMRLVDDWARAREGWLAPRPSKITAVRDAIATVPAGPVRVALDEIVNAVTHAWGTPRESMVLPAIVAYGGLLEERYEWTLAADVYTTARATAVTPGERELRCQIGVQLGRCLVTGGSLDAAEPLLWEVWAQAGELRDRYTALAAEHQIAKLALHRGHMDDAEDQLLAVVVACDADLGRAPALADILARALHDLGHLALRQENVEMAFEYLLRALATYREVRHRNRLLHDLGVAFRDLGLYAVARRTFQYLLARDADDPVIRVATLVNLMDMAVREGSETLFQRYRAKLREERLAPRMDVDCKITIGEGCRRFGRVDEASRAFDLADRVAERHGLHDHRREIATARTAPVRIEIPQAPDSGTLGPATVRMMEAIDELCAEVAGAGV
jgi:tetratricopeptide (TPR) repeat protein